MVAKKSNTRRIYQPIKGTRRYKNTKTGETISAYAYQKKYPKKVVSKTTKKKVVKNSSNKIAPNKNKIVLSKEKQIALNKQAQKLRVKSKNIKPLKNKKSGGVNKTRTISIPVNYVRGKGINYLALEAEYNAFVNGVKNNNSVFGVVINITYQYGSIIDTKNLSPTILKNELPSWEDFSQHFNEFIKKKNNSKPVKVLSINFHLIFTSSEMEKHK